MNSTPGEGGKFGQQHEKACHHSLETASSVAASFSLIPERLPLFRDKLPPVSPRQQRELQHSESVRVPHFAVCLRSPERPLILSAGSGHKLPDPVRQVRF